MIKRVVGDASGFHRLRDEFGVTLLELIRFGAEIDFEGNVVPGPATNRALQLIDENRRKDSAKMDNAINQEATLQGAQGFLNDLKRLLEQKDRIIGELQNQLRELEAPAAKAIHSWWQCTTCGRVRLIDVNRPVITLKRTCECTRGVFAAFKPLILSRESLKDLSPEDFRTIINDILKGRGEPLIGEALLLTSERIEAPTEANAWGPAEPTLTTIDARIDRHLERLEQLSIRQPCAEHNAALTQALKSFRGPGRP